MERRHYAIACMVLSLSVLYPLAVESQIVSTTRTTGRESPQLSFSEAPPQKSDAPQVVNLDDLVRMALERNPALAQAEIAVEVLRGRALQAGLYPNPTVSFIGDELGDKQGPSGILTLPLITQEIVLGGKLRLDRAAAQREVDQADLALIRQRFVLLTAVRQGYFEVLASQRRVEVLGELVELAGKSFDNAKKLLGAGETAKPDAFQFEIEFDKLKADKTATERELTASWRRLAATIAVPDLPFASLSGSLEQAIPEYDYERAQAYLLEVHPELTSAQVGITRAELVLRRAQVERIPNVTVGAGYVRQNQNKSNDMTAQLSVPIPVFNRNQGNIRAAQAELGRALREVERVQNDLTSRLATAYGQYAAAKEKAERYRKSILPRARESYRLTLAGFRGGQFEYLRVLQAQRAVSEANLSYVQVLSEQWRAASEIAGLLVEDEWPNVR